MALDTANKRFSAMNIMSPWRQTLPISNGAVSVEDRVQLSLLYGSSTFPVTEVAGPPGCGVSFRIDPPS